MPYAILASAKKKTIGAKQTTKAIEKGTAVKVFIAEDADQRVIAPIIELCNCNGLPIVRAESMQALGKACGIEVGCAVAALLLE